MTGELCDCFQSKRNGVIAILDAVMAAARSMPVRIWRNDGRFVDVLTAKETPLQVASANWLAVATFATRFAPNGAALLIDIGSTTTDIVPLFDGLPIPQGRTDPERLRSSELVYTGVRRTPLCAIQHSYNHASELFATTLDAYLLLGLLPEGPRDTNTADGRPATRAAAEARLARMLCADIETSTSDERRRYAQSISQHQTTLLGSAFNEVAQRLPAMPQTFVLAGEGEFLTRLVLKDQESFSSSRILSLGEMLGAEISRAACAYAVAILAAEEG
jgi:probable H4MPT-linked C1 transfer pathway protein